MLQACSIKNLYVSLQILNIHLYNYIYAVPFLLLAAISCWYAAVTQFDSNCKCNDLVTERRNQFSTSTSFSAWKLCCDENETNSKPWLSGLAF